MVKPEELRAGDDLPDLPDNYPCEIYRLVEAQTFISRRDPSTMVLRFVSSANTHTFFQISTRDFKELAAVFMQDAKTAARRARALQN